MIRYSCNSCNKSLRAEETIAGKSARCTRCGKIMLVPTTSTRESKSKSKRNKTGSADPTGGVLGDSDSIFDFDDVLGADGAEESLLPKFSQPFRFEKKSTDSQNLTDDKGVVANANSAADSSRAKPEQASDESFTPVFQSAKFKKQAVSPSILAILASGLVILTLGYVWFSPSVTRLRPDQIQKTDFENTPAAKDYEDARVELERSHQWMVVMRDGYLAATNPPESEINDIDNFVESIRAATNGSVMSEANSLFDKGDEAKATKLVVDQTNRMMELRIDVLKWTEDFKAKTYQE